MSSFCRLGLVLLCLACHGLRAARIEERLKHDLYSAIVDLHFHPDARAANPDALHEVTIALHQQSMPWLQQRALELADPQHADYAKWLRREKVGALAANPRGVEAVTDYLASCCNISRREVRVAAGLYLTLRQPVRVLERLFDARILEHRFRVEHRGSMLRAAHCSLPKHLHEHVAGVLDLVHLPLSLFSPAAFSGGGADDKDGGEGGGGGYRVRRRLHRSQAAMLAATPSAAAVPSTSPKPTAATTTTTTTTTGTMIKSPSSHPTPTPTAASTPTPKAAPTPPTAPKALSAAYSKMDPFSLKTTYSIGPMVGSELNTAGQAVYGGLGQTYSDKDVAAFLAKQGAAPETTSDVGLNITQGVRECEGPGAATACNQATADVEYMLALAEDTPTVYWYAPQTSLRTPDVLTQWLVNVSASVNVPSVLSLGGWYLGYELAVSGSVFDLFTAEAVKLAAQGVTLLVSAGDDGAAGMGPVLQPKDGVNLCGYFPYFPSSSPWVTTVGATMGGGWIDAPTIEIACSAARGATITTGGGFSARERAPAYQRSAVSQYFRSVTPAPLNLAPNAVGSDGMKQGFNASLRGYPDVSLAGSEFEIVLGGKEVVISGSSLATVVMAAMVSLINGRRLDEGKASLGLLGPALYSAPAGVLRDVTFGDNSCTRDAALCCDKVGFPAAVGWDPVTGLGSVDFSSLLVYMMGLVEVAEVGSDRTVGTNSVLLTYRAEGQVFAVPAGVAALVVEATGASSDAALGDFVLAALPVAPQQQVFVSTGLAGRPSGGDTTVSLGSASATCVVAGGGGGRTAGEVRAPAVSLQSLKSGVGHGQVRLSYTTARWFVGDPGETCSSVCSKKPDLVCIDDTRYWPLVPGQMFAVLQSLKAGGNAVTCSVVAGSTNQASYPEYDGANCVIGMGGGVCDARSANVANQRLCPCVSTLTPSPSWKPSPLPSAKPVSPPTPGPTPLPGHPTAAPTAPPTIIVTPRFTAPTPRPSPAPSPLPSPQPSPAPSAAPTIITSALVAFVIQDIVPAEFLDPSGVLVATLQVSLMKALNLSVSCVSLPQAILMAPPPPPTTTATKTSTTPPVGRGRRLLGLDVAAPRANASASAAPTPARLVAPSARPSPSPSPAPSAVSSPRPSALPSLPHPTAHPTTAPTPVPSRAPSSAGPTTTAPSSLPTRAPTSLNAVSILIHTVVLEINPLVMDSADIVGNGQADRLQALLRRRLALLTRTFVNDTRTFKGYHVQRARIDEDSVVVSNLAPSMLPVSEPTAAPSDLYSLANLEGEVDKHSLALIVGGSLLGAIALLLGCFCHCFRDKICCRRRDKTPALSAAAAAAPLRKPSPPKLGPAFKAAKQPERRVEPEVSAEEDNDEEEKEDEDEEGDEEDGKAPAASGEFYMDDVYSRAAPAPMPAPFVSNMHMSPSVFNRRVSATVDPVRGTSITSNPIFEMEMAVVQRRASVQPVNTTSVPALGSLVRPAAAAGAGVGAGAAPRLSLTSPAFPKSTGRIPSRLLNSAKKK